MLFKSTNEFKNFAEVTEVNFLDISKTIDFCESQYVAPLLGVTLYNKLIVYYNNKMAAAEGFTADEKMDAILNYCQKILGSYTTYHYYPIADVSLSQSGGRRDETGEFKSAYGNQKTDFRKENMLRAEIYTEQLLGYLETNNVSDWQSSSTYKKYNNLFIKGGAEFNELYYSASPYKNYYAVRFKMTDVQEQSIRPMMSADTYTKILAGTDLSDTETQLLTAVKKAVAYLSVAAAVPMLNIRMDGSGFTVMNLYGQPSANSLDARGGATGDMVTSLQRSCESSGATWMKTAKDLVKVIEDTAESGKLKAESSEERFRRMNGVFGLG